MSEHRTRKNKENPHYNFLYSWTPSQARVKRESDSGQAVSVRKPLEAKRAEIQAKDEATPRIKKDIIRSLILVSFVLALEVVVYLAWKRYMP